MTSPWQRLFERVCYTFYNPLEVVGEPLGNARKVLTDMGIGYGVLGNPGSASLTQSEVVQFIERTVGKAPSEDDVKKLNRLINQCEIKAEASIYRNGDASVFELEVFPDEEENDADACQCECDCDDDSGDHFPWLGWAVFAFLVMEAIQTWNSVRGY